MSQHYRTFGLACAALLIFSFSRVQAQFVTQGPNARVEFDAVNVPNEFLSNDFSLLCWVFPQQAISGSASVLDYPGVLSVVALPTSTRVVLASSSIGSPFIADVPFPLPTNEWSLIGVSVDRANAVFRCWTHTSSGLHASNTISLAALGTQSLGPATGTFHIGADKAGTPSLQGMLGLVALRTHVLGSCDMEQMYASHDFLAPHMYTNPNPCGYMNGVDGCRWMVGHGMTAGALDGGVGGTLYTRSATVGSSVIPTNVHVYNSTFGGTSMHWHNRLRVVQPVSHVQDLVYVSHFEPPFDGFFVRPVPTDGPTEDIAGHEFAHRARQLLEGPNGLVRVVISANSRAMRFLDGDGGDAPNFLHGFLATHRSSIAGIAQRPLSLWTFPTLHTWFGFSFRQEVMRHSGTVESIMQTTTNHPCRDFSHLHTGSVGASSNGPGAGVWLFDGGLCAIKAQSEPGSLMTSDAPLVVEANYLAYPGASMLRITPERGPSQATVGTTAAPTVVPCDTSTHTHTLGSNDSVVGQVVKLEGDHTSVYAPGALLVVTTGPAFPSSGVIESVVLNGTHTSITLKHPLHATPGAGDQIATGPFEMRVYSYEFAQVASGDPNTWRGFEFAEVPGGAGAVVFSVNAYRPNVNGFIMGSVGWGGNGYQLQIDKSSPEAIVKWMKETKADIWLQVTANQFSQPPTMLAYTTFIRQALPNCDIIWAGEMSHGGGPGATQAPWHQYIIDNADNSDVIGLSSLDDPRLGTFEQQITDGMRSDTAHITARGNTIQAEVWLDLLAQYLLTPCPIADFDHNGTKNVFDYIAFGNAYAAGDLRADIDQSGTLNIFDYIAFGNNFAACQ